MVGVPGKSKGCVTCRRRKKGCDKQAPFCGQCLAAGLVCEGYPRHEVWINSSGVENLKYTKADGLGYSRRGSATVARTPDITLHESLVRTAREGKYVGLFLTSYLPNGQTFSIRASQFSPFGWMRYHEDLCRLEKTLSFATLAVSLSTLGTRDGDNQLKGKGLQAYRMAVREMTVAIRDPQRSVGDGLLASVRLMRLFEILFGQDEASPGSGGSSPQIDGYFAHTDGEMALFVNRGHSVINSEASRQLFADGRVVSFILGITRRQRSLFSQPEWTSMSWNGIAKTPLDKLLDTIVHIPSLLEDLDGIRRNPIPTDAKFLAENLLLRSRQLEQALYLWRREVGHQVDKFDLVKTGPAMPVARYDRDFALIHMSCLYWCSCLLLQFTIQLADKELDRLTQGHKYGCSTEERLTPGMDPFDERNPMLYASRIVRCIGLMFQPNAGNYGALVSFFPLGLTMRFLIIAESMTHPELRVKSEERTILEELYSRPFMGTQTGRFLNNLQREDTKSVQLRRMEGPLGMEERAKRWWFSHANEKSDLDFSRGRAMC